MQEAKPIVKWAGGKTYLLNRLTPIINKVPVDHEYCEPMVGGGAIYFKLHKRFKRATISDLINLYRIIKDNVDDLIEELASNEYFYTHKSDPDTLANYRLIRSSNP